MITIYIIGIVLAIVLLVIAILYRDSFLGYMAAILFIAFGILIVVYGFPSQESGGGRYMINNTVTVAVGGGGINDTWAYNYTDYYNKTQIDSNFTLLANGSTYNSTYDSNLDTLAANYSAGLLNFIKKGNFSELNVTKNLTIGDVASAHMIFGTKIPGGIFNTIYAYDNLEVWLPAGGSYCTKSTSENVDVFCANADLRMLEVYNMSADKGQQDFFNTSIAHNISAQYYYGDGIHASIGNFSNIYVGGGNFSGNITGNMMYWQNISSTPANPPDNFLLMYARDDGTGQLLPYVLDPNGIETSMTGGGGGCTTLDCLSDVLITAAANNQVLWWDGTQWINAQLNHSNLTDIGIFTHNDIDAHIGQLTNHTENKTIMHLLDNELVAGIKTFSSFPITPSASPTTDYQVANKKFVDDTLGAVILGTDWQASVVDKDMSINITDVVDGTRYIVKPAGTGAWTGRDNYIVQWSDVNGNWTLFAPVTGWAVFTTDDLKGWIYNGATWVQFNAQTSYTASLGVEKVGNDFRADLLAAGALGLTGNELKVNVDGLSIEIGGATANTLNVKVQGINNSMLLGLINNSNLLPINRTGWVNGSSLTSLTSIPSAAGLIPTVNLGTGSATASVCLKGDQTWGVCGSGGGGGTPVNMSTGEMDFFESATYTAWTNMPAAPTELFGTQVNRIRANLAWTQEYRLVMYKEGGTVSANSQLDVQYSTVNVAKNCTGTADWYSLNNSMPSGNVTLLMPTGLQTSASWGIIKSAAKTDVCLRVIGMGGDGVADPRIKLVRIQFMVGTSLENDPIFQGNASNSRFIMNISTTEVNATFFNGNNANFSNLSVFGYSLVGGLSIPTAYIGKGITQASFSNLAALYVYAQSGYGSAFYSESGGSGAWSAQFNSSSSGNLVQLAGGTASTLNYAILANGTVNITGLINSGNINSTGYGVFAGGVNVTGANGINSTKVTSVVYQLNNSINWTIMPWGSVINTGAGNQTMNSSGWYWQ